MMSLADLQSNGHVPEIEAEGASVPDDAPFSRVPFQQIQDAWDEFADSLDEVRRGGSQVDFWVGVAVALYWRWAALKRGDR